MHFNTNQSQLPALQNKPIQKPALQQEPITATFPSTQATHSYLVFTTSQSQLPAHQQKPITATCTSRQANHSYLLLNTSQSQRPALHHKPITATCTFQLCKASLPPGPAPDRCRCLRQPSWEEEKFTYSEVHFKFTYADPHHGRCLGS